MRHEQPRIAAGDRLHYTFDVSNVGTGPVLGPVTIVDDHAVVRSGLHLLLDAEKDIEVVAEAGDVTCVSGATFAVRCEVWDSLGGFDPEYFAYGEDVDLTRTADLIAAAGPIVAWT